MSIKKWALVIFSLLILCAAAYWQLSPKVSDKKNYFVLQSKFMSKSLTNRIIQVKLNFKEVATDSEKTEITAVISMPFDFNDKLYFKWKLGPAVVLSEGELSGEIQGLLKNDPKEITLKITGFSKEANHHIGFEIHATQNSKKIYGEAFAASDLENTFENTVQNVEKIKASQ